MATFSSATKQQLSWLVSCRANAKPLIELFEAARDETFSSLVTATDTGTINRMQGRAQAIKDFLELLATADQIVGRMK